LKFKVNKTSTVVILFQTHDMDTDLDLLI